MVSENSRKNERLQEILQQHEGIFQEQSALPLPRSKHHRIPLLLGTRPVSVKLYRYPYYQKRKIEKQLQGMLDSGVIRESTTSY